VIIVLKTSKVKRYNKPPLLRETTKLGINEHDVMEIILNMINYYLLDVEDIVRDYGVER
jgi:hypothetical protein